jgi:hypothetical protein
VIDRSHPGFEPVATSSLAPTQLERAKCGACGSV